MIRSLAGRGLACLAVLGLLSPWAVSVRAEFTADSCLGADTEPIRAGGTSGVRFVVAADLDADGDVDVATASFGDDRIAWFENESGIEEDPDLAPPWPSQFHLNSISTNADGANAVVVADLNGDCGVVEPGTPCLDLVSASANDDKISWYRSNNQPNPKFTEIVISTDADLAQSVFAADVNGDMAIDVLSASYLDNKISWYENDGNDPPEFTEHVVTTEASGASSVYAADMDGDGDTDIFAASILDNKISWWEQIETDDEPPEMAWVEHVITTTWGLRPVSVVATDLNNDCNPAAPAACLDVLVAFNGDGIDSGKITWFETTSDGENPPTFTPEDIKSGLTSVRQVFALAPDVAAPGIGSDLNGDMLTDVLVAYDNTIAWFPNTGADPGRFGNEIPVTGTDSVHGAQSVHAVDLDGDGFTDVQSASSVPGPRIRDDRVFWYHNNNDDGTFEARPISLNAASPESIVVADIDGDCDDPDSPTVPCMDVVSATSADNTVAWHRNGGPTETAVLEFTQNDIARDAVGVWSVFVEDLDEDCPAGVYPQGPCKDVIAAIPADGISGRIVWYRNEIAPPGPGFTAAEPGWADFVILQGAEDTGDPTEPPTSNNAEPMSVFVADVNGDCRTEAPGTPCKDVIAAIQVAAEGVPDKISWFENDHANPPIFTEHVIPSTVKGPRAVFAEDLDNDGDVDLLVASSDDDRIVWFRSDGNDTPAQPKDPPEFTEINVSVSAVGASWVSVADLQQDCPTACPDVDTRCYCREVLSASARDNKIAWYEIEGLASPDPPDPLLQPAVTPEGHDVPESGPSVLGTEPELVVDVDLLEFGEVFAGQVLDATGTVTIKNDADLSGGENLVITSITSTTAEFKPTETELTLAPQAEAEISVVFEPTAVDYFSGTLEFTSNAVNTPPPTVEMTGRGSQFLAYTVATDRRFARFVSSGDVDDDGLIDIVAASGGDGVIASYLQLDPPETEPGEEEPPPVFEELILSPAADEARAALVTDLNADNVPDVATAFYFEIAWHQGGIAEVCNDFDADGDGLMSGTELTWIWTSFGSTWTPTQDPPEPNPEWWAPVDFNRDGLIDGDDLAIGTSLGIWSRYVNPTEGPPAGQLCNYSCVLQEWIDETP